MTDRRTIYVFVREEGFYPLELANDEEARANAECNPGTLRVENLNGESAWTPIPQKEGAA